MNKLYLDPRLSGYNPLADASGQEPKLTQAITSKEFKVGDKVELLLGWEKMMEFKYCTKCFNFIIICKKCGHGINKHHLNNNGKIECLHVIGDFLDGIETCGCNTFICQICKNNGIIKLPQKILPKPVTIKECDIIELKYDYEFPNTNSNKGILLIKVFSIENEDILTSMPYDGNSCLGFEQEGFSTNKDFIDAMLKQFPRIREEWVRLKIVKW